MKSKKIITMIAVLASLTLSGCSKENQTPASFNEPAATSAVNGGTSSDFPNEGVSVDSISVKHKDAAFTAEQNEKICSLMKDMKYLTEDIELAVMSLIEVKFSDGSVLTVDDNTNNYGSYFKSGENEGRIVTLPYELKEYILESFYSSSADAKASD